MRNRAAIRRARFLLLFLLFCWLIIPNNIVSAGSTTVKSRLKQPIPVFVSIGAHVDFCQEIGGKLISVKLALPPGKSPATYAPTPQQVQALSQSRLYFKVGLPFETALLAKIKALPHSPEIIDTQKGIKLQPMQSNPYNKKPANHDFSSATKSQQHSGLDPHTWLDPELARQQATTIYSALCRIDPDSMTIYTNNFNKLKDKIDVLDKELKKAFTPFSGSIIFVYHPAFGYFARAFGLRQVAIELGGKRPRARELADFIKKARTENISALFVQPQFDQQSAQKIAQTLGCAVIGIDPLAENYCSNLRHIATVIRKNIKVSK